MSAMNGILASNCDTDEEDAIQAIAKASCALADAMIKELAHAAIH